MTQISSSALDLPRFHQGQETARDPESAPARLAARPPAATTWVAIACLLGGTCLLGCGGQDDSRQAVPPPENGSQDAADGGSPAAASGEPQLEPPEPAPAGSESAASEADTSAEPAEANNFALPPGEIPTEASGEDDSSPAAGGLQMPNSDNSASDPSESQSSNRDSNNGGASQSAGAAGELDLQYASWESVHQRATRGGKITVVDLWALSCQPCLKEFPGLVRLNEQYGESVHCIGFNVDFDGRKTRPPESYREGIEKFLQAVDARFPNYISNTPSLEVFADVGIDSIPAVLVFDQQGKLVEQFADTGQTAGFTYEADIIPLVAKLAG